MSTPIRCYWPKNDPLQIKYHDEEWGVPLFDDQQLFEFLVLETFQAGLSWQTILNKRENFRLAFDHFNAALIANYNATKRSSLMENKGIVRHQLKINATVTNAQSFLSVQKKHGNFSSFIWQFTNGKTIQNCWKQHQDLPTTSIESDAMSKALKKEGFKFVGSTICYAFMQAVGMVNDHIIDCYRFEALRQ
jgi:DNA-3-methyladenine glycosylase I